MSKFWKGVAFVAGAVALGAILSSWIVVEAEEGLDDEDLDEELDEDSGVGREIDEASELGEEL